MYRGCIVYLEFTARFQLHFVMAEMKEKSIVSPLVAISRIDVPISFTSYLWIRPNIGIYDRSVQNISQASLSKPPMV